MTTWGSGPFDNDIAHDFLQDLQDVDRDDVTAQVHAALEIVLDTRTSEELEVWQQAVAAAALVACAADEDLGAESPVSIWLSNEPIELDVELTSAATNVLEAALASSPLATTWERTGVLDDVTADFDTYIGALHDN